MSFDGSCEIKILNAVLGEILQRYDNAGAFDDYISSCINEKCLGLPAAFCYENYDSNDIPHIPEKLDDVAYCIFDLIEKFEEDNPEWEEVKNQFRAELKECHDEIDGAYQYVLIETSEPGYWEGDEESRVKTFAYTKEGFLESLTPKQSKPKSNSKKKKANGTKKETLKDIFSQMDESASDIGIIAENGSLIKINSRKHEAYLGESDCAYIPEYITEMSSDNCNEFNRPGYAYEKFVITSNCKKISAIVMGAQFKWFYIIDSDTQEVIFKTDKFYDKNEEFGTDTLRDFEEHYFDDPEEAMACKDYKPVDDDYIANKESEMIREVEKQMIKSAETARRKVEEDKRLHEVVLAKHAEEWKKQYGKYVQNNPEVEFQGKVFVFTGLTGYEHDEDHPAVKAVVARGGKFHPRMIRNVDYLVADPPRAGETKSNGAVKNINEGRNTTIILLEDLQKILDGKSPAKAAAKGSKEETKAVPAKKSEKETKKGTKPAVQKERKTKSADMQMSFVEMGFKKLSDTVSVNDKGASPCFIINNEWSFVLPEGCSYAVDSEFDGGAKQFEGAIDFSSSIKTMVMKDGGYFNFALEPHLNLMGEYYTVDACRNDDRFGDNSGASKKYVFADTDELYVDITAENTFFALILNIRVRGAAISPYTFDSIILPRCGAKQSDIDRIKELTFEIAKSIRLAKDVSESHKKTKITTPEKNAQSGDFFITDNRIKSCYCDKEEIIIPNGVTTIGSYAVSEKALCKKIIIPNSVVEICDNAFSDNPALEEVVFGSSVKTIGAYAFHGCEKLLTIILPKGIETIGNGAFNNYKNSLETQSGEPVKVIIPDSVTFIGKGAFHEDVVVVGSRSTIGTYVRESNARHEYTDGEEIHIPTNFIVPTASSFEIKDDVLVKYLGEHDDIRLPASIKKIGKSAFKEKSPRSIWLENSVEEIEKEAFSNTSLEFVHIPGTVKKIPEYAFGRCNSLATVQLEEGIQEIGSYAFRHIPAKEILLPHSLRTIGRGAFADSGITHLEIPDNVGEIGEYLCSDCSKLKSLTIGNSVPLVPQSAFSGCKKLNKVVFGKNLEMIDERAFQETSVADLVLPDTLHNIGNSAFSECDNLRSVVFNDNLYRISSRAFYKCATLNSISLPASIKRIDFWAFRGTGITEVVIPYTAKNVDSWAFEDSVKKKRKSKPKGTTEEVAKEESEFVIEDGILKCYYGKKSKANIEIPDNITTIGKGAFAETKIASVIIPASVRMIEYKAFANCDELKTVEFGENVEVIGDYAFAETKITNLNLPQNLRSIGKNAFEGRFDSELKRINFGKELYSIGEYAFTKNAQLKEISFPDSLDEIGANAFSYCYGLTNISFGSNLKTIGTGAFSDCKALTNIAFKNSLKNIGFGAFQGCENLEDILLPDSVELIGDYAFNNCKGREYFEFPASVKKIGSGVLGNWESLRRLKIPASVQEIEDNNAWAKITLIVEKGSYAEEYARQKECKYETYEAVGRSAVTSVSSNISAVADDTRETHRREREESLRRHAEAAEAARKAEEERKQAEAAEAARKAEEERKQAEAAEAARKAEERRKQAEAAEAARRAEEARKQAEAAEIARQAELRRIVAQRSAEQSQTEKARLNSAKNAEEEIVDPIAEERRRLLKERKRQMRIVEDNNGLFALFGEKARKRKAAEERIEQINKELARLKRRK